MSARDEATPPPERPLPGDGVSPQGGRDALSRPPPEQSAQLRALEEDLEAISRSEPVQLLEEERLRKEIAELRAKIERVPFFVIFVA